MIYPYTRSKYINLKELIQPWLRQLAKQFIRFQSATKALYTLQQYLNSITQFSKFLQSQSKLILPEDIDRNLMLEFIKYVHKLNYINEAKNKIITHIRLMITIAGLERWINITKE